MTYLFNEETEVLHVEHVGVLVLALRVVDVSHAKHLRARAEVPVYENRFKLIIDLNMFQELLKMIQTNLACCRLV